jgi:large subunit ribosomal protein L9
MATTLQVILQTDVPNVGDSGELVKVRPGFARNFLLPRKLAVPATAGAVKRIEHERAVAQARNARLKKEAQELAQKLNKVVVKLTQRVGDEGKLFGSITTRDIAHALKAQGFEVEHKRMHLAEPIRALGTYEVQVKVFADVAATFKVDVTAK